MEMKFFKNLVFFVLIVVVSCSKAQDKAKFSEKALTEIMLNLEGDEVVFKDIIKAYKGKRVVIDVWASWCGDCIGGLPRVKELQSDYKNSIYLFLSVDKNYDAWKRGIEKYQIRGEHFFIPAGWDSDFNKSIDLDWIPRYIVVDETGAIELFKATKATDKKLEKAIKG